MDGTILNKKYKLEERVSALEENIPEPYELPTASADTLGGIKVGDGLSITEEGVLSANQQSGGSYALEYLSTSHITEEHVSGFNYVLGTITVPSGKSGKYTLIMHNRPSATYSGPKIGTNVYDQSNPVITNGLQLDLVAGETYNVYHGENTTDVSYSDFYVEAVSVQEIVPTRTSAKKSSKK